MEWVQVEMVALVGLAVLGTALWEAMEALEMGAGNGMGGGAMGGFGGMMGSQGGFSGNGGFGGGRNF